MKSETGFTKIQILGGNAHVKGELRAFFVHILSV